jgi:hypothetical protein
LSHDEEVEPPALRGGLVGPYPAHEHLVAAGGVKRVGHVDDHDAGGLAQQLERLVR